MTNLILAQLLLEWYARNGRDLPWRFKGGAHPNPYHVLVSEIMLQQTTVKTVIPYFQRFIEKFPTVESLANAPLEEVYLYWQGLGYYARARSLHASAQMIAMGGNGNFPQSRQDVSKLKGLGNYTIASFLALAFNQPETVVDGNVIRIICRMFHLMRPKEEITGIIRNKAEQLADASRPADYASAIMDLGALVCTPRNPQCLLCPWQNYCLSKEDENIENIPLRAKAHKREVTGFVYIISNQKGDVLIRRRHEKGLLSGLYEFPWNEKCLFEKAEDTGLKITHIFTHIKMNLKIFRLNSDAVSDNGFFIPMSQLSNYPMSTLMKKVAQKAFS